MVSETSAVFESHGNSQHAILYRLATADHMCPSGLKAKDLLERKGFTVDDKILGSPDEAEEFKQAYSVATTPQVFIEDERIGGYESLRKHLGKTVKSTDETSYQPCARH